MPSDLQLGLVPLQFSQRASDPFLWLMTSSKGSLVVVLDTHVLKMHRIGMRSNALMMSSYAPPD